MVGLHHHRHDPKHAAPKPEPSRKTPGLQPPPEWARPVLDWLERKARGEWTDPEHEQSMSALARKLERWQQEQRNA